MWSVHALEKLNRVGFVVRHRARPLTHDLIATALRAFGARVKRVILDDFKDDAYFARLVLGAEHAFQQQTLLKLDVRPRDGFALAVRQEAPICVPGELWDRVEDTSKVLRKLQGEGPQAEGEGSTRTRIVARVDGVNGVCPFFGKPIQDGTRNRTDWPGVAFR